MISIKPKWVAKILNGEKTIEIRKTMPKCDLPIDVYIYATKDKELLHKNRNGWFANEMNVVFVNGNPIYENYNGKIVAKFTLNKVETITPQIFTAIKEHEILKQSRLKENELFDYVCSHDGTEDKPFYAWHISNLEIFDKPKELSEFHKIIIIKKCDTRYCDDLYSCSTCNRSKLTKAPQSWCYVEASL